MFFIGSNEQPKTITTKLLPYSDPVVKEIDSSLPSNSAPDYKEKACEFFFKYAGSLKTGYSGEHHDQVKAVVGEAINSMKLFSSSDEFKTALSKINSKTDIQAAFSAISDKTCAAQFVKECWSIPGQLNPEGLEKIVTEWIDTAKSILEMPIYFDYKVEKWPNSCRISALPRHPFSHPAVMEFEDRTFRFYHDNDMVPFQLYCKPSGTGKTMLAHTHCMGPFPSIYFVYSPIWQNADRDIQFKYRPFLGISKLIYGATEMDLVKANVSALNDKHKWHLVGLIVAVYEKLIELKKQDTSQNWLELQCKIDHVKFTKMSIAEAAKRLKRFSLQYGGPMHLFMDHVDFDPSRDMHRFTLMRWVFWTMRLAMAVFTTDERIGWIPQSAEYMIFDD